MGKIHGATLAFHERKHNNGEIHGRFRDMNAKVKISESPEFCICNFALCILHCTVFLTIASFLELKFVYKFTDPLSSFPRKRESSGPWKSWIPARPRLSPGLAGMTLGLFNEL
jgi:hypothetical protein